MSQPVRRPRGTEVTHLHTSLEPEIKARVDAVVQRTNLPLWKVVEAALTSGDLDEYGIPDTWDLPRPTEDALMDFEDRKTA